MRLVDGDGAAVVSAAAATKAAAVVAAPPVAAAMYQQQQRCSFSTPCVQAHETVVETAAQATAADFAA